MKEIIVKRHCLVTPEPHVICRRSTMNSQANLLYRKVKNKGPGCWFAQPASQTSNDSYVCIKKTFYYGTLVAAYEDSIK